MWILRVIYSWIYDTIVYFCFCFFLIYQILMNVMAITEAVVMTASTKLEASTVSAHPDTSFWMIPRPVWVRSTFIRNIRGSNFVCLLITFPPFNNVFALVWSCQTFFLIIIFVWIRGASPMKLDYLTDTGPIWFQSTTQTWAVSFSLECTKENFFHSPVTSNRWLSSPAIIC